MPPRRLRRALLRHAATCYSLCRFLLMPLRCFTPAVTFIDAATGCAIRFDGYATRVRACCHAARCYAFAAPV